MMGSPALLLGAAALLSAAPGGILCLKDKDDGDFTLDYDTAAQLASHPLECYDKMWPHKYGTVYDSEADLETPKEKHPVFYGCFDWHSAVHGHWLLAYVLNRFPGTELADNVTAVFDDQFKKEKIDGELELFAQEYNEIFERTYGWAWLLKLQMELMDNPDDGAKGWSKTLQPLVDRIVTGYKEYLPSLVYAIRSGVHPNSAFGFIFALEYAIRTEDVEFSDLLKHNSTVHFLKDTNCPISWEPSGSDFLSPCLQEAQLMSLVIEGESEFNTWLQSFQPELFDPDFDLEPGEVIDPTDGHLVHLDGLNFSRAWNLYFLITKLADEHEDEKIRFLAMGDEHVNKSMDEVVGSDYAGSHWLASFLLHALATREAAVESMKREA